MCDSVSCSVNDVWINETICVNKVKGLSKDMYDNIEPMVIKCVNKVPDNSNACIADSEVSDSTMSSSVQGYGEVVSPDKLGPSGSEPGGFSSEFLDCSESETDNSDIHGTSRFWELEQGGGQIQNVQGRLKKDLAFWQDVLEAPRPVIEWIEGGYKLPLLALPPPFFKQNHKSALTNTEFVDCSNKELLENYCIHMVTSRPHISSPLSVVTNREGKKRLVLNLRYLNNFLLKERFKYEDIKVAISLFTTGNYVFTFDLKSGYHHVDIHQDHWKYLGFQWGVDSKVR